MENISLSEEYTLYSNSMSIYRDIKDIVRKYVNDEEQMESLLLWAMEKSSRFYLRNIGNTKSNIEETKFEPKNNIGIEYSKDSRNKLSYRNKPLIPTNKDYVDICDMIRVTSGNEKETLRYLLFGIKCIKKGVEYDIEKLEDVKYESYFNVLDEKHNTPCPSCGSMNTTPIMIQTRAADEPPLVKHSCRDCKNHFNPPRFRLHEKKRERISKSDDDSPPESPEPKSPEDPGIDDAIKSI